MNWIQRTRETNTYLLLGVIAFSGIAAVMAGFGMASRNLMPDALNVIMLGGVTIGIVSGYVFRDIREWDDTDESERGKELEISDTTDNDAIRELITEWRRQRTGDYKTDKAFERAAGRLEKVLENE